MRSAGRAILTLAALTALGMAEARAQASFSLGFSTGPLFAGVSFGVGGPAYSTGSVFVGASFGTTAVEFIARFRVRHAFISIAALHPLEGPMDMAFEEAELARMALSRADNRVILTDSTKFGKTALVKVCDFSDINRIYTDDMPFPDLAGALERGGVELHVARPPVQA